MVRCCFCNITKNHKCGRTFHKFPLNNQHILKQWLQNYPLKNWTPKKWSVICSDHFTEECFDRSVFSRVRLKPNSVPSRFDNPHSYCIYCKRKRTQQSGYSFFKFPLDKSYLLKKWLDNMKIKDWTPNDSSLLCSQHFEQTCFRKIKGIYMTLKEGSVPTIFKIDSFNNPKPASPTLTKNIPSCKTEFSQKISFDNNNRLEPSQQIFCNKFKDEIQTHSVDQSTIDISMNKNMSVCEESFVMSDKTNEKNVDESLTLEKTEIISFVEHDHNYAVSPLVLHKKLLYKFKR